MPPSRPSGSSSGVRIKICGLTRVDEALACLAAGADWIGLNFHPRSPRFVEPARAKEITAAISDPARVVGLFVDRPAAEVAEVAGEIGLKILQLHGHEPPEDLVQLGRFQLIRAYRLAGAVEVQAMLADLDRARALGRMPDAVLADASVPGQLGGTGQVLEDDVLDLLPSLPCLILAGGLTPRNVAGRVLRVRPWMVDVASGVECAPGRKDMAQVVAFIQAARSAGGDHEVDKPRS